MSRKRGGGGFLFSQVVLNISILVVSLWIATYWYAYHLGFHPRLGGLSIGPLHFYSPHQFLVWFYRFHDLTPHLIVQSFYFVLGGVMVMLVVQFVSSLIRERTPPKSTTYGSARFADEDDIERSGLLDDKGVFLGRLSDGRYLRHDTMEAIGVVAPPRKGKGAGIVQPTALSWLESVVFHDIRSETWLESSRFRSQFSHCIYFNPIERCSAGFNPLMEIRKGDKEVGDTQNLADIIVDPDGKQVDRSHWKLTSFGLLVGVILHILYAGRDKSLTGVLDFITDPHKPPREKLREMLYTNHLGNKPHETVVRAATAAINKPEGEFGSLISTTESFLNVFHDPVVSEITRRHDFYVSDLMQSERPISLYMSIPPAHQARLRPIFRIMMNQIIRGNTEAMVKPGDHHYKHRLLLLLDEFTEMGRLDALTDALPFMGGYGIKPVLIFHGLDQLEKVYSANHSLLSTLDVKVIFAASDPKTSKTFSEFSGPTTEMRSQTNYAGNRLAPWLNHKMVASQETARPLLTVGEITQLDPEEALIFQTSYPPIRANKIVYYEDPTFASRLLGPMPLPEPKADAKYSYPDCPPKRSIEWKSVIDPVYPDEEEEDAGRLVSGDLFEGRDGGGIKQSVEKQIKKESKTKTKTKEPVLKEKQQQINIDDGVDNLSDAESIHETGWTV